MKTNKNDDTQCDMCGQTFDSITATIRHRFKVHPNSPTKFYCHYCGMQFPVKVCFYIFLCIIYFFLILYFIFLLDTQR